MWVMWALVTSEIVELSSQQTRHELELKSSPMIFSISISLRQRTLLLDTSYAQTFIWDEAMLAVQENIS